jgi:cardiolipin-specific phospholipase
VLLRLYRTEVIAHQFALNMLVSRRSLRLDRFVIRLKAYQSTLMDPNNSSGSPQASASSPSPVSPKNEQTDQSVSQKLHSRSQNFKESLARSSATADDVLSPPARGRSLKSPTAPTGVPLSKIMQNAFPLSYDDSFQQWRAGDDLKTVEEKIFSYLPFFPVSDGLRVATSLQVPVEEDKKSFWQKTPNFIDEFEVSQIGTTATNHLVLLHGYGAGKAFFYKNLDAMSKVPGWTIHALDLLGYGRSSRPRFRIPHSLSKMEGIERTEDFFVDSLEKWRQERGIDKFTLVAHSLGAYVGTAYATRYPENVDKFLLVSPAGVPRSIYSIPVEETGGPESRVFARGTSRAPGWFRFLWECNVSPFSLVRNTGPLGPKFVSGWTSRRFALLPEIEATDLHKYTYGIFNAKGSGEYALNYLLAPGAHGRWPLAERAYKMKCPTLWMYGSHDWMDVNGGREACRIIRDHGGRADLMMIPDSGHHIYLDNDVEFNKRVVDFMTTF